MTGEWLNISQIEAYLYDDVFGKKVTENVFVGDSLPNTLSEKWKDMMLIDCGLPLYDLNGYGRGNVNIFLYVKPRANGVKDVKRMFEMENAALECIKEARNPHYVIRQDYKKTDYDANHDLHVTVINLKIQIF